jgi:hypothetical protein
MSILGKFDQQPLEIEIYSIRFEQDMSATDEITGAWNAIAYKSGVAGKIVASAPYTATTADDKKLIRTAYDVTLPVDAADGYTQFVCNMSQSAAIDVSGISLAVREGAVIVLVDGDWTVESSVQGIVVATPGDQRVRLVVSYGKDGATYKTETTITTAEGRQLQDELLIRFKED